MFTLMRLAAAGTLALALGNTAMAGELFVDESGFAASGYDVVAYFDKEQNPLGTAQPPATPGRASITAEHGGATFAFATEANRDRFLADPEAFRPQFDGHCAYGVAKGGKVPGNPHLWRIVDGKLYLNITRNVVGFWEADIPGNLEQAYKNWPELEPQPATDRSVPEFDHSLAPVGG